MEVDVKILPELPNGWAWATLPMLGEFGRGKSKHRPRNDDRLYADGKYPFLQTGRIRNSNGLIREYDKLYSDFGLAQSKLWPVGTVCITIAANIAESGILKIEACFPDSVVGLVPHPEISGPFVEAFVRTAKENLDRYAPATAQKNINLEILNSVSVPIPPAEEQERIVEKIETLFARLDKGEEAVRDVQKLLTQYRQSVLKSAVTGQLTADWRAENSDQLESGRDHLTRILATRREQWEGRGRYKEPVSFDQSKQMELPNGWIWATVDQLSSAVEYGSSAKCSEVDSGVPVLRMGNIVAGKLDLAKLKYLPTDHSEFPKLLLEDGDLIFNRTNSAELVGKTAIFSGYDRDFSFASYLIRVKLIGVEPQIVSSFINSLFGRQWVRSVVSQQVGQANVNGTKLKALAVPLAPEAEQAVILERLEDAEARISTLEDWCETETKRSASLRQSILKDAFAGKLVPQDPADEPASDLLARIAPQEPTKKPTRRKAKA